MRLVSLTPSNTELVAFLGLEDQLVGVDDWSDWPPSLETVQRVGPDLQIDLEAVAALEPDLVLASRSVPGMERVVEGLREHGLPHVVLAPKRLAEVVEQAIELGERLGHAAQGIALAAAMTREFGRIRQLTREVPTVRVYWEWWPKPTIAAGGTGWMSEVLDVAGATNILADHPEESPPVTAELVAHRRPDVVAACWCGTLQRVQSRQKVLEREGWAAVTALRRGAIETFPEELFGRPGPRLVEGARHLAATLHPSLVEPLGAAYAWVPDELKKAPALSEAALASPT